MYKLGCYFITPMGKIHTNEISSINSAVMTIAESAPFVQLFSEPASNSAIFRAKKEQITC